MTKAEEFWLKFTEERRAEQDALDAIDKDPVAKAAKAAKEAEEKAARSEYEKKARSSKIKITPRSCRDRLVVRHSAA